MKDAFGAPQSLLILGGTSEIGLATARRLIARRTRTVWLAGRPSPALDAAAQELRGLRPGDGVDVRTVAFDALDPGTHEEGLGKVFAEGDIDMALLAFGVPGDQEHDEAAPLAAVLVAQTNYTGAVSAGLVCAGAMQAQGHGALVVLSSVAGERARRDDFIYGSSKAGLDAFAQGLGDAMHGTGVQVMTVRPGHVRSRRAPQSPDRLGQLEAADGPGPAGTRPDAAFVTTPEDVARAIELGLRRRSGTVWVPGRLRLVMSALRHLPRPLFRAVTG